MVQLNRDHHAVGHAFGAYVVVVEVFDIRLIRAGSVEVDAPRAPGVKERGPGLADLVVALRLGVTGDGDEEIGVGRGPRALRSRRAATVSVRTNHGPSAGPASPAGPAATTAHATPAAYAAATAHAAAARMARGSVRAAIDTAVARAPRAPPRRGPARVRLLRSRRGRPCGSALPWRGRSSVGGTTGTGFPAGTGHVGAHATSALSSALSTALSSRSTRFRRAAATRLACGQADGQRKNELPG